MSRAETNRSRTSSVGSDWRSGKHFTAYPLNVMQHPNFQNMSSRAHKLLNLACDLLDWDQRGRPKNNGDISLAFGIVKKHGWRSNKYLTCTKDELVYYGFLIITKQGGHRLGPTLFAVTRFGISESQKYDAGVKRGPAPLDLWTQTKRKKVFRPPKPKNVSRPESNSQDHTGGYDT